MQSKQEEKQKVTLYLPPELHRRLKIKAAVESDSMSAIVEKAIVFYMRYPEVVDEVEVSYGRTHQVYSCPECSSPLIIQEGEMLSLENQPSVIAEELPVEKVPEGVGSPTDSQGEEELVPC